MNYISISSLFTLVEVVLAYPSCLAFLVSVTKQHWKEIQLYFCVKV